MQWVFLSFLFLTILFESVTCNNLYFLGRMIIDQQNIWFKISLSGGGENGEEYIVETVDEDDSGSAFKPIYQIPETEFPLPSSFFGDYIIKETTKK